MHTQSIESMIDVLKAYIAEHPIDKRELDTEQDWRPHDPRDGFHWQHWEYRRREERKVWCEHIKHDAVGWSLGVRYVPSVWMFCPICAAPKPNDCALEA